MSIREFAAAMAAVVLLSPAAHAEPAKLIFATASAPDNALNHKVFRPWAAQVTAASKGALEIEVRDGVAIANATNYYDRVVNDVVQISWGVQDYLGNQFQRSQVVTLPFIYDNSINAAVAYYRLYRTGLLDPEYSEIHPLFFCAFETSGVHFTEPHSYVVHEEPLASPDGVNFNHGLAQVITAVMDAGMTLTAIAEHDSVPWNALGVAMEDAGGGEYRLRDRPERLAATYTLQATKPLV